MKNFIKRLLIVVVVALAGIFIFKDSLLSYFANAQFVTAEAAQFDAGIDVGAHIPAISALHQGKEVTDLAKFSGPKGLVVMINRSIDWCPFCIHQTLSLNDAFEKFQKNGIGVVMITYDAPELQEAFMAENDIKFPIISDIDTRSMKALKVLHPHFPKGHEHHGIPYPGTYILSPKGYIMGKLFVEGYINRVSTDSLLEFTMTKLRAG